MRIFKFKIGFSVLFAFLGLRVFAFGQTMPDKFIVDVEPSSFAVNEAVDVTIKAVKNDGTVVKDYDGDVWIEVEGIIDSDDYIVPSDHVYTFLPQDQGVKLFSKGLTIKVEGTYKIVVMDLLAEDEVYGEKTVIVGDSAEAGASDIEIITPLVGGTETAYAIEVLASAPDLPNSPFQILLNDIIAYEAITTENGDITAYVTGAQQGQNTLEIRVINLVGEVLGKSEKISFDYQSSSDSIFNYLEISPKTVKQGEKVSFTVSTAEDVTSVELRFSDGTTAPMDRVSAGSFAKQLLAENAGQITVSLSMIVGGNTKQYSSVDSYTVQEFISIGNVKIFTDSVDKTSVTISWDPIGDITRYKVLYGTDANNLGMQQEVSTNQVVLKNLNPEQTYFVQIYPLNAAGDEVGTPSSVQEIQPGHLVDDGGDEDQPTCIINNIQVSTGKIGDKYYLMRTPVENAEKYIVYRSDWSTNMISDMNKVGETTDTRFEYWFDTTTRTNTYAYFIVQAVCTDGAEVQIANVQKVHVGPGDTIFLFVVIFVFLYIVYKLYQSSENSV